MSMINREVSDFFVHAYQNGEFKMVTRDDILGGWSVFFFYPADFTFVCPTELSDLQDRYEDFKAAGCEVYSISTDTHFVHKAWHDTSEKIGKITFPMLADPNHELCEDFEVMIESDGMAERGSFIINPEGRIVSYEVSAGNVGRNADELFRKMQACQFVAEHREDWRTDHDNRRGGELSGNRENRWKIPDRCYVQTGREFWCRIPDGRG